MTYTYPPRLVRSIGLMFGLNCKWSIPIEKDHGAEIPGVCNLGEK